MGIRRLASVVRWHLNFYGFEQLPKERRLGFRTEWVWVLGENTVTLSWSRAESRLNLALKPSADRAPLVFDVPTISWSRVEELTLEKLNQHLPSLDLGLPLFPLRVLSDGEEELYACVSHLVGDLEYFENDEETELVTDRTGRQVRLWLEAQEIIVLSYCDEPPR